ncbi:MAG: metallophosphoesterase family protein [Myxococcales bacterium]|nr:metallophosphoesterase family protein [Myxococcales bacterium]
MRRDPVDALFCLGDLVAMGPEPSACLALLRELRPNAVIRGNTDRYLLEGIFEKPSSKPAAFLAMFRWCWQELSSAGRDLLARLPETERVEVDGFPILLCHGVPSDDELGLTPESDRLLAASWLRKHDVKVVVGGHTHIPCLHEVDGGYLVNDGSIGYPFDGDGRACYWRVRVDRGELVDSEFRRLEYPVEETILALERRDVPWRGDLITRLRTARST